MLFFFGGDDELYNFFRAKTEILESSDTNFKTHHKQFMEFAVPFSAPLGGGHVVITTFSTFFSLGEFFTLKNILESKRDTYLNIFLNKMAVI